MLRRLSGLIKGGSELPGMVSAITDAAGAEAKMAQGMSEVFGASFKQFADSQPKEISTVLKSIQEPGMNQATVCCDLVNTLSTLPADLISLNEYEVEIARRQAAIKSSEDKAKRSALDLAKQEQNLKAAEEKGSPDLAKHQTSVDAAKTKSEQDREHANKVAEESKIECEATRKKFVDALTTSLRAAAERRIEACDRLIELSEAMMAPIEELSAFDDVVIPKLKQKLSDLEREIVD